MATRDRAKLWRMRFQAKIWAAIHSLEIVKDGSVVLVSCLAVLLLYSKSHTTGIHFTLPPPQIGRWAEEFRKPSLQGAYEQQLFDDMSIPRIWLATINCRVGIDCIN